MFFGSMDSEPYAKIESRIQEGMYFELSRETDFLFLMENNADSEPIFP